MILEIIKYKNILKEMPNLLNDSPFKMNHIIKETGISSPTFYRKLKNLTFTVDEVMKIARILKPEESYSYELQQSLKRADDDLKEGRVFTRDEVMNEVKNLIKD